MASVYLSLEKILKRLPDGVFSAIKNRSHSVTIAGDYEKVANLVDQLKTEGHIVKPINSAGVAFHSPYLQNISDQMRNALLKVAQTSFIKTLGVYNVYLLSGLTTSKPSIRKMDC